MILILISFLIHLLSIVQCTHHESHRILNKKFLADVKVNPSHYCSDMVSFPNNIFASVVQDNTNSNPRVAFHKNGELLAGSPSLPVSNFTYPAHHVQMCSFNDDVMVTYDLEWASNLDYRVYGRIVKRDGSLSDYEFQFPDSELGVSTLSGCLQIDTSDQIAIWTSTIFGSDNHDVYIRIFNPVLNTFTASVMVADNLAGSDTYMFMTKVNTNSYIAIFSGYKPPISTGINDQTLFIQEFDSSMQKVGSNILVTGTESDNNRYAKVKPLSDGGFVFVFTTVPGSRLQYAAYNADKSQKCPLTQISSNGFQPDIEVYKDIAYIAFYQSTPDPKVIGIELDVQLCNVIRSTTIYEGAVHSTSVAQAISQDTDSVGSVVSSVLFYTAEVQAKAVLYEFLIEQKDGLGNDVACPNDKCLGCYGSYTCPVCVGSDQANMIIRRGSTSDCSCTDGYYNDSGLLDCQQCDIKCVTCSNGISCDTCPSPELNPSLVCTCPAINYLDTGGICQECLPGCQSCSNGSSCDSCIVAGNNVSLGCTCPAIFYRDGGGVCQECLSICASCSDGSSCDTCLAVGTNPSLNCTCPSIFYRDGGGICQQCQAACASCSDGSSCDTCLVTGNNPALLCTCPSIFYRDGSGVCQECLAICASCSDASSCDTCVTPGANPSLNCTCPSIFYNDINGICQECLPGCQSCSNGTTCDTCIVAGNNPSLGCTCPSIFYRDGFGICQECLSICASCSDNSSCDSCLTTGNNPNLNCTCPAIFYRDGGGICQQCQAGCASCSDGSSCDTCLVAGNNPALLCTCPSIFYRDGSGVCQECLSICASCSDGSSCDTCISPGANPSLNCTCPSIFYNDTNGICQECLPGCQTCSNGTTCDTCIVAGNNPSLGCTCPSIFYRDGSGICQECLSICQTCSNSSSCDTCKVAGTNPILDCTCPSIFYRDGAGICQQCLPICASCSNSSSCDSCKEIGTNPDFNCTCPAIFYRDSSGICQECQTQCASCVNSSTCSSCKDENMDVNEKCLKPKPGYFETTDPDTGNPITKKCDRRVCATCEVSETQCITPCHSSCSQCNTEGHCIFCEIGQFIQDNICENCNSKCLACNPDNKDQCLSCRNNGIGRSQDINDNCGCLPGYFEMENQVNCVKCLKDNCKTCDNQGVCLECYNNNLLPPSCSIKKSGFFVSNSPNNNNKILQCQPKCQVCENSSSNCLSCNPDSRNRERNPPCQCMNGYYDDNGTLKECQKCPQFCLQCISSEKCTQCFEIPNLHLNEYTFQCECKDGYKMNIANSRCEKCYDYKDTCVFECPQNSFKNENKRVCENKSFIKQSIVELIWVCGLIVLFSMFSTIGFRRISYRKRQDLEKQSLSLK